MSAPEPTAQMLPYGEILLELTEEQAKTMFSPRQVTDQVLIFLGDCPRCGVQIDPLAIGDVVRGPQEAAAQPQFQYRDVVLKCNCTEPHEGRPEGREGCGAYWSLRLRRRAQS
jgi:hypothetical protein